MKLAHVHGIQHIRVYMDSELVVDQVNGDSEVREPRLVELHEDVSSLRAQFKTIRVSWVPRAMNAEADRLATDALGALDPRPSSSRRHQHEPAAASAASHAPRALNGEARSYEPIKPR